MTTVATDPLIEAKQIVSCFLGLTRGDIGHCIGQLQAEYDKSKSKDVYKASAWGNYRDLLTASLAALVKIAEQSPDMVSVEDYDIAGKLTKWLAHVPRVSPRIKFEFDERDSARGGSVLQKIEEAKEAMAVSRLRSALHGFWQTRGPALRYHVSKGEVHDLLSDQTADAVHERLYKPLNDLLSHPDTSTAFLDPVGAPGAGIRPIFDFASILQKVAAGLTSDANASKGCAAILQAFTQDVQPHIDRLKLCAAYAQGQSLVRC